MPFDAEGTVPQLISRALHAVGMPRGQVLRLSAWRSTIQDYQSDRSYEPYFSSFDRFDSWFDPVGGGERTTMTGSGFPRSAAPAGPTFLSGSKATWMIRDTSVRALAILHPRLTTLRPLNPWAVLADFQASRSARVAGRCTYRDFPRISLERTGPLGTERLLLDTKSLIPVALVRTERHSLWGQVAVEYVWSNWDRVAAGVLYPLTAFRVVDGRKEISQTVTALAVQPPDSAPRLAIPDTAITMPATFAAFDQPTPPDTVRAGENTWLLRSREYTTAITLRRDTVFVLDATLSEARARLDADWVSRLFAGRHPIVLVVTDLAWPHIGGVRYWVAKGAILASHRVSRAFLESVIARRWTDAPDELERQRTRTRPVFRAVEDSLALAGGDVVLHVIDGPSSEGALMVWIASDRLLWASDYLQNIGEPTEYGREVLDAASRARLRPERFAAEHLALTSWSRLEALFAADSIVPEAEPGAVDGNRLRPESGVLQSTMRMPDGSQRPAGSDSPHQLGIITWRGRRALLSVHIVPLPRGNFVDSTISDPTTLFPWLHASAGAGRRLRLEFDGADVRGTHMPDSQPAQSIDQRLQFKPYDSTIFDVVIAALPLANGYRTRLPFYVFEQGGVVWYTVQVTGSETLALTEGAAPANAWIVLVEESREPRARLWIAQDGRAVLRTEYPMPGGGEFVRTRR